MTTITSSWPGQWDRRYWPRKQSQTSSVFPSESIPSLRTKTSKSQSFRDRKQKKKKIVAVGSLGVVEKTTLNCQDSHESRLYGKNLQEDPRSGDMPPPVQGMGYSDIDCWLREHRILERHCASPTGMLLPSQHHVCLSLQKAMQNTQLLLVEGKHGNTSNVNEHETTSTTSAVKWVLGQRDAS